MDMRVETQGTTGLVTITGRLDSVTSPQVEQELLGAPLSHQDMVVDCTALDFLSSAGLRVLLRLHKKLAATQGKLVLHSATAGVREVLEISGLAEFLPIFEDREKALAAL